MTFTEIALIMWPYWLLGIGMLIITSRAGYLNLLRIQRNSLKKFAFFLLLLTGWRLLLFALFPNMELLVQAKQTANLLPWGGVLTVFWEDACHGLPLLLTQKLLGTKHFVWLLHTVLTIMVMVSFGLGHTYQGLFAAVFLSFYVPYSVKIGERVGFGTVMIGHTLFDLVTLATLKYLTWI